MAGPAPTIAQVRVAVRRVLAQFEPDALVAVACSGGPDSMALAAALAFEAPRQKLRAGFITVDHQLQPGSDERARVLADWARHARFDPVQVAVVDVGEHGGPEAAAREARYAALEQFGTTEQAAAILLGHTRDDQAETVLLAMARGSGAHAVAGMPSSRGIFYRPLLRLPRSVVHEAARAGALPVWEDPHNSDPRYTRSRIRGLLPHLDEVLGGGAIAGLARTAELARDDAELLDELAIAATAKLMTADRSLNVVALAGEPAAIRTRVLHRWALALGAPAGALAGVHVAALNAMVLQWRGQGPVYLPGGIEVIREAGHLRAKN